VLGQGRDYGASGSTPCVRTGELSGERPRRKVSSHRIEQTDPEVLDPRRRLRAHVHPKVVRGDERGLTSVLLSKMSVTPGDHTGHGTARSEDSHLLRLERLIPERMP
jgi:hypothetical protein